MPLPALLKVVDVPVFMTPPDWMRSVPALVRVVGDSDTVPAVAFTRALLVKVVGLIVSVCPAVLPIRVPLLTMVATLLSLRVP